MRSQNFLKHLKNHLFFGVCAALLSASLVHSAYAGLPAQHPIIIGSSVKPIMMLNMSRDHQLFFKLYDDYSDITDADGGAPDGQADTTYNNNYNYYGYFDSDKCYTYDKTTNHRFNPVSWRNSETKSCDGTDDWSGNFLNWATMTRVDAIRKILYGGYRAVDTAANGNTDSVTVLERAFLPNDTHSFAKYYLPTTNVLANLKKVIPDAAATAAAAIDSNNNNRAKGITICNTTDPATRTRPTSATSTSLSQNVNTPPLMKVAIGNYELWANNERWQCLWRDDMTNSMRDSDKGRNGNVSGSSGLFAYQDSPQKSSGYDNKNYNVRVRVCAPGFIATNSDNEKCKEYSPKNIKPTGLLHKFGETDTIRFGLMTGSYAKNKSGGVLRKPVRSFSDEVDITTYGSNGNVTRLGTGVFKVPSDQLSIVSTLNKLRIFGYNYAEADGLYNVPEGEWNSVVVDKTYSDNCSWFGYNNNTGGVSPNSRAYFENGRCTNWGNPQAEMYLESLRYLAGLNAPTPAFDADDSTRIPGLVKAERSAWADPISETPEGNYCAPLNVLQFNSSTTSYDGDELAGASDLGMSGANSLDALTKKVGDNEGITSGSYFVGKRSDSNATTDTNQLCTPKTIADLSKVDGVCPESPRLEGSYQIAGLAYYARSIGLPSKTTNYKREKVRTYGVALAPAVPKVTVTTNGKTFTILPACRNLNTAGSINNQVVNGVTTRYRSLPGNCAIVDFKVVQNYTDQNGGKVYVAWEDMEQGGDYDQDMWGIISYKVTGGNILEITTDVIAQSASGSLGFGYVVSGVEAYSYTQNSTTINTDAGFNVHSGINSFAMTGTGCPPSAPCNTGDAATVRKYKLGSSTAKSLENPLYYAAKWGGYSKDLEDSANTPTELVNSIKTRDTSDSYYYATDPRALEQSLENAFNDIASTLGASATVAANSTRLDGETYVYQARFNSENWSGDVLAFEVKADGSVESAPEKAKWRASETIARTGRNIYTYDGASARALVSLTTGALNNAPTLKEALKVVGETDYTKAEKRFNWLLGSAEDESDTNLRKRDTVLGDIVNSDPAFAGAGNLRYRYLPKGYGSELFPAYANAKRETDPVTKKRNWRSLILVGANSGMMHALDADTGAEVFAYIPRGVYAKLANLSSVQYRHEFTVDGPIAVGDVYFDSDNDGVGGEWRTIAVGTLGAGGRGVYALDITDVLKSSSGTPKVIFDVSAEDASVPYKDYLGYVMSRPLIVPTPGYGWRVIFGNGPNSNKGTSALIAIDPENPNNYEVIDTGAKLTSTSTDNGLGGVALLPNADGVIEAAYAGDVAGNLWKFSLSSTISSEWSVAYTSGATKLPLIRVVDRNGVAQPITSTPTLGLNELKPTTNSAGVSAPSTMVYFGTGKYYEVTDAANIQVQSVYAVADVESMVLQSNADRLSKLEEKEITSEASNGAILTRTISNDVTPATGVPTVDWNTKNGWFIDLKVKNGTAKGERVISKPLLVFDRLIFATFVPSSNQCDYGGSSWLMELVGVGDKYIGKRVLGETAIPLPPVLGDPIIISAGENLYVLASTSGDKNKSPEVISLLGNNFGDNGRISWQQLK